MLWNPQKWIQEKIQLLKSEAPGKNSSCLVTAAWISLTSVGCVQVLDQTTSRFSMMKSYRKRLLNVYRSISTRRTNCLKWSARLAWITFRCSQTSVNPARMHRRCLKVASTRQSWGTADKFTLKTKFRRRKFWSQFKVLRRSFYRTYATLWRRHKLKRMSWLHQINQISWVASCKLWAFK